LRSTPQGEEGSRFPPASASPLPFTDRGVLFLLASFSPWKLCLVYQILFSGDECGLLCRSCNFFESSFLLPLLFLRRLGCCSAYWHHNISCFLSPPSSVAYSIETVRRSLLSTHASMSPFLILSLMPPLFRPKEAMAPLEPSRHCPPPPAVRSRLHSFF